jgi:transposase
MVYSNDLRWRGVVLHYTMGMCPHVVGAVLGVSHMSIKRWTAQFEENGHVDAQVGRNRTSRWPQEVYVFVQQYVAEHPCFYFDELEKTLREVFPSYQNFSAPTICRALRFDLNMTRKILTKRARESLPIERKMFGDRLKPFYYYPEQLVFVDETSKDGRSALRRYAWSIRGVEAIVDLPFSRGERVSALAALGSNGFIGWKFTHGTFTRVSFHQAMLENIIPHLQRFPLPRSIVVMDNAKIHMYSELQEAIEQKGAMLFFLPPYSPQLNPIEVAFGLVKKWVQKEANLAFNIDPEAVLSLAFQICAKNGDMDPKIFKHCGYTRHGLIDSMFQ